jgi:hypothetical protein
MRGTQDALVPPFLRGARGIEGLIVSQQTHTIFDLFVDTNGWCLHLTLRIFVQVLHIILQLLWGDAPRAYFLSPEIPPAPLKKGGERVSCIPWEGGSESDGRGKKTRPSPPEKNMQSKHSTADRHSCTKNLCLRFPDSFQALAPKTVIFCHLNIAQNLGLAGQTAVRCGRMRRNRKSGFFAPLGIGNFALDADGAGAASPQTVAVDDFGVAIVKIDVVFQQNFTQIRSAIALKCFSLRLYFDHSNLPRLDLC